MITWKVSASMSSVPSKHTTLRRLAGGITWAWVASRLMRAFLSRFIGLESSFWVMCGPNFIFNCFFLISPIQVAGKFKDLLNELYQESTKGTAIQRTNTDCMHLIDQNVCHQRIFHHAHCPRSSSACGELPPSPFQSQCVSHGSPTLWSRARGLW